MRSVEIADAQLLILQSCREESFSDLQFVSKHLLLTTPSAYESEDSSVGICGCASIGFHNAARIAWQYKLALAAP